MSLKRAAMQGALWNLIENVGIQMMSFVLFLVLARLIDPADFGIVQIAITVLGLLTIFVEQGFSMTIVQRRELSAHTLDTAFWIGVGTSTLAALGLIAVADVLANVYKTPTLAPVLRALAISLPVAATCGVQTALFIRGLAFRAQALRRLIAVLGGGLVGIGMAFAGFGVWSLVGRFVAETVLDCIVTWRAGDYRPGLRVSRPEAHGLVSFGSRIVGSNLISYLNRRADDLLIGFVLGPVALGYYAIAFRAMLLVTEVALRAAQRTAIPVFSELQHDHGRLRNAYYLAIEFAAVVACPVFLGLSATAPELCLALFGPKWLPAVPAMQVLGLAGVGMSVSLYTGPLLIAIGKPNWFFNFNVVTALINVVASLIAVRWGILAMAVGYVVRGYLLLPLAFYAGRRAIGAEPLHVLRLTIAPTFAALTMAAVIELLRHFAAVPASVRLALFVPIGAMVYVAIMAFTARTTIERMLSMARPTRSASGVEG